MPTSRALLVSLDLYGNICPDCDEPMWHQNYSAERLDMRKVASIDHVWPRQAGGRDLWGNYEAVCVSCNSARWHRWKREHPDWRELTAPQARAEYALMQRIDIEVILAMDEFDPEDKCEAVRWVVGGAPLDFAIADARYRQTRLRARRS